MRYRFHHYAALTAAGALSFLCMPAALDSIMGQIVPDVLPVLRVAIRLAGAVLLYILYILVLSQRRGRFVRVPELWVYVFGGLYICILLTLLFGRSYDTYSANYIPFYTIRDYVQRGWSIWTWVNLIGNVLAFTPFGVLLARLFLHKRWAFIGVLVCILTIEFCQQAFSRGTFDIDDIMLNAAGAFLGIWLYDQLRGNAYERQKS